MCFFARGPWAFLSVAVLLAFAPSARAQTYTWNQNADDVWNLAGNWNPAVLPNAPGVTAVFGSVITADRTVSLTSDVSVGSVSFESTNRSYTISGPSTLSLDNGAGAATISMASNVSANQTIAVGLSALSNLTVTNNSGSAALLVSGDLALGGHNLTTNGFGAISFGKITGTGNLTAAGGVTTLTSSASDFAGTVTLATGGVLSIGADAQLGAAANSLAFAGGTLRVTGSAPVSTARALTFSSTGTIDVLNTDATSGFTIQSAITSAPALVKTGGGILTLTAANTYGGTTFVQAGTLRVTAADILSPNSTLSITGGAFVRLNGFNQSVSALASVNSTSINPATLDLGSGSVLTIGRQGLFSSTAAFAGSIVGSGDLVKTGLGTQQMGAPAGAVSSFTGTTTIRQGILEVMSFVPASGSGPLGNSTSAVRLGDPGFAELDAVLLNADQSFGGFARSLTVAAGTGYRTIGHQKTGLANNGFIVSFSGPITLNKDLQLFSKTDVNENGSALSISGAVGGTGGLVKIGAGAAYLAADNGYTGTTTVLNGRLILSSANGAIRSSSGIVARTDFRDAAGVNLYPNEGLILIKPAEFAIQDFTPDGNRIGDVDVTLSHGLFTYNGRVGGASSESFHSLVLDRGPNVLTVTTGDTGATTSATLAMTGGLVRNNNSTLVVVAPAVLGDPDGQNFARVTATTPPTMLGGGGSTSTNHSIIPWMYHDTNPNGGAATSTETFLTYGPNGLRPLLDSEYVGSLTASGTLNNVRLTATSTTLTQEQTINSLRYGLSANGTINLNGFRLTVNSGAILSTGGTLTFNGGELAFGTAEGIFHATATTNTIVINSVVSGSGGLTTSFLGSLHLNGVNTYTGPTTINAGGVSYNSASSFGPSGEPIRFRNAISGGMTYTGAGATTLPNPVEIGTGSTTFSVSNGGTVTLNGVISGTALGDFSGPIFAANTGTILLRGNNTFTGLTQVTTGTVGIVADNNLGAASNRLYLGSGPANNPVLRFDAPGVNIAKSLVNIQGHATINTNGHDGTVSSPIFGSNTTHVFTKAGAGTLTLTATNSYVGTTTVAAGTLWFNGTLTNFGSFGTVTVASGGTLGGSGTVDRQVTVNSGGGLAPGAGVGQLTVRSLGFAASASAIYDWEAGASVQDRILVTAGPVNLTGIQVQLRLHDQGLGTNVSPSQHFPLITVAGAGSVTGYDAANFTVDFSDAPNWVPGQYTIGVGTDGGNTVVYLTGLTPVPVPEPTIPLTLGATALTAVWVRKRAHRSNRVGDVDRGVLS